MIAAAGAEGAAAGAGAARAGAGKAASRGAAKGARKPAGRRQAAGKPAGVPAETPAPDVEGPGQVPDVEVPEVETLQSPGGSRPSVQSSAAGGGFLLGVAAWVLGLTYIRSGPDGVKALLRAKFLNQVGA